jgi:3-oxo-5alpha-steroid 4-dehydrogenase
MIAIDRFSGGGASQLSGGVVYMGGGTRRKRSRRRDPGERRTILASKRQSVRGLHVRRYARQAPASGWLGGARWRPATEEDQLPNDASLYFSGNEVTELAGTRHSGAARPRRFHRAAADKLRAYLLPPLIQSMERDPTSAFSARPAPRGWWSTNGRRGGARGAAYSQALPPGAMLGPLAISP